MWFLKINQIFEGCKGVVGITDDIVVFAKSEEDYDRHMHVGLMQPCRTQTESGGRIGSLQD